MNLFCIGDKYNRSTLVQAYTVYLALIDEMKNHPLLRVHKVYKTEY